jgi:methyltransferase
MFHVALFLVAFVPMLVEAVLSARHERQLRAAGASEPKDDVFAAMQVVYPLSFAAMIGESWIAPRTIPAAFPAGVAVFAAAKGLKYWAIATLGTRWTFRVLVPPNSQRTSDGPYRFMRHPNYLAVAGELGGFALMAGSPLTGAAALIVFIALMRARIRVEERTLDLRQP